MVCAEKDNRIKQIMLQIRSKGIIDQLLVIDCFYEKSNKEIAKKMNLAIDEVAQLRKEIIVLDKELSQKKADRSDNHSNGNGKVKLSYLQVIDFIAAACGDDDYNVKKILACNRPVDCLASIAFNGGIAIEKVKEDEPMAIKQKSSIRVSPNALKIAYLCYSLLPQNIEEFYQIDFQVLAERLCISITSAETIVFDLVKKGIFKRNTRCENALVQGENFVSFEGNPFDFCNKTFNPKSVYDLTYTSKFADEHIVKPIRLKPILPKTDFPAVENTKQEETIVSEDSFNESPIRKQADQDHTNALPDLNSVPKLSAVEASNFITIYNKDFGDGVSLEKLALEFQTTQGAVYQKARILQIKNMVKNENGKVRVVNYHFSICKNNFNKAIEGMEFDKVYDVRCIDLGVRVISTDSKKGEPKEKSSSIHKDILTLSFGQLKILHCVYPTIATPQYLNRNEICKLSGTANGDALTVAMIGLCKLGFINGFGSTSTKQYQQGNISKLTPSRRIPGKNEQLEALGMYFEPGKIYDLKEVFTTEFPSIIRQEVQLFGAKPQPKFEQESKQDIIKQSIKPKCDENPDIEPPVNRPVIDSAVSALDNTPAEAIKTPVKEIATRVINDHKLAMEYAINENFLLELARLQAKELNCQFDPNHPQSAVLQKMAEAIESLKQQNQDCYDQILDCYGKMLINYGYITDLKQGLLTFEQVTNIPA